jgi:hypothetical protein
MAISNNFNDETENAGHNWMNYIFFGGGGGRNAG